MDSFMLQDEGVRDRIRQAEEFLDPSMYTAYSLPTKYCYHFHPLTLDIKMIPRSEVIDQILFLCFRRTSVA